MEGYVATIGMFDGVHRGHQFVLQHVVDEARQRGLQSMAITFDKTGPETLTPLVQKRILLMKTGIDRIEGDVSKANELLGYPYTLLGSVKHGEHIGTKLGFPTANIVIEDQCQLIPATGAYAVKIRMENSVEWKHGMMNIGTRPTFDGQRQTMEVNVFRLKEDLYGQQLQVAVVERLRGEQRFDSIEALKEQLRQDAIEAERILA